MTTSQTTTRTSAYYDPQTRQPLYVSGGAVDQDGLLKLMICNRCGSDVVWATSNRTGRKYLVNTFRGQSGARYYVKRSAHKCEDVEARRAAWDVAQAAQESEAERNARRTAQLRTALDPVRNAWLVARTCGLPDEMTGAILDSMISITNALSATWKTEG